MRGAIAVAGNSEAFQRDLVHKKGERGLGFRGVRAWKDLWLHPIGFS